MVRFSESDFPFRSWDIHSSVSFRKTSEEWGGFSNMAAGFPIVVNNVEWRTSEALYQALRFPDFPEVQELIRTEKSPMAAKMVSKPHRHQSSRKDWDVVRIDLMYWCLRVKLTCNFNMFGELLRKSRNAEIVENSSKDRFWGAVPVNDDYLQGQNVLGVLITKLRQEWVIGQEFACEVEPPELTNCRLLGGDIPTIEPPEYISKTLFDE
jgi:ribA/ribD-fused uncharacterized protein